MVCIQHPIPDALKNLVNCILYIHKELPAAGKLNYFHPPTPETGICFHFNNRIQVLRHGNPEYELQPQTIVVGPQITPVVLQSFTSYTSVRVGLVPGGLFRLTGICQTEMVDKSFDAEVVFGKEMVELNRELCQTTQAEKALNLIVQFLLLQVSKCSPGHILDEKIFGLLSCPDSHKVYQLARSCGLSLRQFERISLHRLGMRPKLYGKIIRFSRAYSMAEREEYKNWTDLAYLNNYYDSRHLKKDFKNFTGKKLALLQNEISEAPIRVQAKINYR